MSIYVFLTRIELLTHSIHVQSNENQLNIFSKNYSCGILEAVRKPITLGSIGRASFANCPILYALPGFKG